MDTCIGIKSFEKERLTIIDDKAAKKDEICNVGELTHVIAKTMTSAATIAAWQTDRMIFGEWTGEKMKFVGNGKNGGFNEKRIIEIRVFNENEELHLTCADDKLKGRYVKDGEGEATSYVDTVSPLWGKSMGDADGVIHLRDNERHIAMDIPNTSNLSSETSMAAHAGIRYGLMTRSYVSEVGEMGQVGYADMRFVKVIPLEQGGDDIDT